ncbi:hypothetical protein VPHD528_0127 [Vibrio phage D528]
MKITLLNGAVTLDAEAIEFAANIMELDGLTECHVMVTLDCDNFTTVWVSEKQSELKFIKPESRDWECIGGFDGELVMCEPTIDLAPTNWKEAFVQGKFLLSDGELTWAEGK